MANTALTMNMENQSLEDSIMVLLEKLEAIRDSKETAKSFAKHQRLPMKVELRTLEFWRSVISECIATFFFVFIVSGIGMIYTNGDIEDVQFIKSIKVEPELVLSTAMATGLSMTILNQCFGRISGGHVNPAVSIALAVIKKISPLRCFMYVVAQCGGGIAGAALVFTSRGTYPLIPLPTMGSSWERLGIELVLSYIVVFTFCSVTERKLFGNNSLVIGAAYAACTFVNMPMLNPARALGYAFVMSKFWEHCWIFWFGPIIGGVLAAIIFEYIFNGCRRNKRPKESIDGDSSSIHSGDEPYDDDRYNAADYRHVRHGNPASAAGGYCASVASTSVFSSSLTKPERVESLYGGNKYGKQQPGNVEGIYSGSRSLYNAKVTDGIYSGTKSMYTKSPPLTRANLNRSQSVYAKSQNPRDILPKPGPLIPAQSLYPISLGNGGHLNANIRDFGAPNAGNFISSVKANDGNFVKVGANGPTFNQNTLNFLAGRNGGSKSYHDISESCDKGSFMQQQQPNFNGANHVTNQNVQNQHLQQNAKPEKSLVENIYGIRNSPTGGIYPGNDVPRPENMREPPPKREHYDLIPRSGENRSETPRSQGNSNFSRTAAYVKSVQNNPNFKPRESNYDIVPSGIREVSNFNQKPHNRSETSDYGSNRSDTSLYGQNRSMEPRPEHQEQTENSQNGPENRFNSKRSEKQSEAKKHDRPELPLPPVESNESKNQSIANQKPPPPQHSTPNGMNPSSFLPNVPLPLASNQWNQPIPMRHLLQGGKPMMPEPGCNGMLPPGSNMGMAVNMNMGMNFLNQRNESRQSPLSSVSSSSFSRSSPNPPYS